MEGFNSKDFMDKLIELTKNNSIKWEYLDNNKYVCDALKMEALGNQYLFDINFFTKMSNVIYFDTNNSFISTVNGNYILICCIYDKNLKDSTLNERLVLKLVPRTFREIKSIKCDEEDGTLQRLQSLVKSLFPNADDIVNDIFNL